MEDVVVVPAAGLSEVERVVDTFVAPRKTFTDILRSGSWWLPFVLMLIVSLVFTVAVGKKVGWEDISQRQIQKNHFVAERLDALPPDQRAAQYQAAAERTKHTTYFFPVIILLIGALVSLLWWATINFAFGGSAKYGEIFAVWMYAGLPKSLMALLAAVLLFAGVGTDNFDLQNALGTNVAYYMGPDSSAALKAALSFFDLFGLWSLALGILGVAIVSRTSNGKATAAVGGWWAIGLLLTTASAAIFS